MFVLSPYSRFIRPLRANLSGRCAAARSIRNVARRAIGRKPTSPAAPTNFPSPIQAMLFALLALLRQMLRSAKRGLYCVRIALIARLIFTTLLTPFASCSNPSATTFGMTSVMRLPSFRNVTLPYLLLPFSRPPPPRSSITANPSSPSVFAASASEHAQWLRCANSTIRRSFSSVAASGSFTALRLPTSGFMNELPDAPLPFSACMSMSASISAITVLSPGWRFIQSSRAALYASTSSAVHVRSLRT